VAEDEIWVAGEFVKAGAHALVRMEPDGDDWKVTGLVLTADEINSQTLKSLPLNVVWMTFRTDKTYAARARTEQPAATRGLSNLIDAALESATPREESGDWQPPAREKLSRPDRTDPDGHSRAVAAAYEEAVRLGKAPGPAIAAEAGVPIATAHGWIREARRREHLPKGRRGRAG
jgi:hypothetical protein